MMKDFLRSRWAAVGAAVAVTLGAGGMSLTQAAISSGEKPVYVALDAPCRLVDTRPSATIGAKNTPIAAGEANAYEIQVTGANGDCTGPLAIPADAVAVATNVTAIAPAATITGRSFFTVYPADAALPDASNLNFLNGQAPVPNKVDVGLSATGKIKIYNNEGTAHAAVDVFGYYIDHTHDDRYYTKTESDSALGTKADTDDVYTKGQVDAALDSKQTESFVQTGSSANDPFVNFIGAPFSLDSYCGDPDGCRISVIREQGGTVELFGPITMRISGTSYWYGTSGALTSGTSSNGSTISILGTGSCYFTDWDSSGSSGNGDQNTNFGLLRANFSATPQTCTVKVED